MKYKYIKWLLKQRPNKRWGIYKEPDSSKYMPHQGLQECARRLAKCVKQS